MHFFQFNSHIPLPAILALGGSPPLHRQLELEELSYEPRSLLQRTKEFFVEKELRDVLQTSVQRQFVRGFLALQNETYLAETDLRVFMQLLDAFFFSGRFTGGKDPRVKLEFRGDIFEQWDAFKEGKRMTWTAGFARWLFKDVGASRVRIKVNIEVDASEPRLREGRLARRALIQVLETLVHEMAHAHFILFACQCLSCQGQIGASGHGAVWQELKQAMSAEIRSWDWSLRNFYMNDQDTLDYV